MGQCPECEGHKFDFATQQCGECGYENNTTKCDKYFTRDDEKEFKRQYAIQFMAAYTASHFSECCSTGRHQVLREPPVEDAHHLAEEAWREWCDKVGLNRSR